MSVANNIRKVLFFILWVAAGCGTLVLLIAAVNARNTQLCTGFDVVINGRTDGKWFVDKQDILQVITDHNTREIRNTKMAEFDLQDIENKLKKKVWVQDAQLYFNNNGTLKVRIKEREPVARVFSRNGRTFYLDSSVCRLPVPNNKAVRLPVFTGFPGDGLSLTSARDKRLAREVQTLASYLLNNEFWMAQVAQVDITPAGEFEIIPTAGSHIIEFGTSQDYEQKFSRLFVFYKQVLAKSGLDTYQRIKVQYDDQVIGVKK